MVSMKCEFWQVYVWSPETLVYKLGFTLVVLFPVVWQTMHYAGLQHRFNLRVKLVVFRHVLTVTGTSFKRRSLKTVLTRIQQEKALSSKHT